MAQMTVIAGPPAAANPQALTAATSSAARFLTSTLTTGARRCTVQQHRFPNMFAGRRMLSCTRSALTTSHATSASPLRPRYALSSPSSALPWRASGVLTRSSGASLEVRRPEATPPRRRLREMDRASMANLPKAMAAFDECCIYDTSTRATLQLAVGTRQSDSHASTVVGLVSRAACGVPPIH